MNAMVISASPLSGQQRVRHLSLVRAGTLPAVVRDTVAPQVSLPTLRLTRRGRFVFLGIPALLTAAVLVFAALAVVLGSLATPAHAGAEFVPVDMADYAVPMTVLQGESLWSIAAETNPTRDIREVVSEIVALNELGSGVIHAGQRLFVPLPK